MQNTKSKIAYTTVRFPSCSDALLEASRMCPVIGFYIFCASSQNLCQVAKNKKTYTTVRVWFHRDTLLAGASMRAVVGFYSFDNCKKKVLV